jgi:glucose/arabinose dehydrogenase
MLLAVACGELRAQVVPRITVGRLRIELERVVDVPGTTMSLPLYMDTAGDGSGRFFFPEKSARLLVRDNGVFSTFLDLRSEAVTTGERGLLGLAFHPGYADPLSPGFRKLYTFHSVPIDTGAAVDFTSNVAPVTHHNVLTEWQVSASNPNQVDVTTRREIFREAHISDLHNAGTVTFGPDGYLYGSIGTAPFGSAQMLTAQNNSDIMGTIYRIDPLDPALTPSSTDPVSSNGKYRIPASNPFVVNNSNPNALDEIFAYGMRNPYRFSVDPDTGLVFAGDVGQGASEEVNVVPLGGNMGWPYYEGTFPGTVSPPSPPPATVAPLAQYRHTDGRAVVGGFVYRGSIPELQGKYIFGEFSWGSGSFFTTNGRLLWLDPFDELGNVKNPSEVAIHEFATGDSCSQSLVPGSCFLDMTLVAFGTDDDGELYAIGARDTSRSIVYKFVDAFYVPEGDYNEDQTVDDADYSVWRAAYGKAPQRIGYGADGNADNLVDAADYVVWRKHFGESTAEPGSGNKSAPEPSTMISVVIGFLACMWSRQMRSLGRERS